jgi:hypothetical protein
LHSPIPVFAVACSGLVQDKPFPYDRIERDDSECVKEQKRNRILQPALLGPGFGPSKTVNRALNGAECEMQERFLAGIDSGEMAAERARQ